jgi:hypothetical protein
MPRDLDLTFDISTGALTLDRVVGNYVKRSETLTLSVTIVSNGASATIPAGLVGTLKPVNTYGTTLAQWTTFSQVGATNVYTASTTINAAAVTTLLGTTTEQTNCVFDFAGAGVVESDTLALVLKNNVTRDDDTAPTALLNRNDFLVTNGTGLLVNVAAGYAANGAFVAAQASLAITNATNYIEVTAAGVASVNTTAFTAGSYPLATVVASAGAITSNTDLRAWITPKPGASGGVTSITGTANEITVTGTTTPTLSLPSALTFTSKTVTGGTFTGGAFNGTVGATTPSTVAGTTITGTSSLTLGTNGGTGGSVVLNGATSGSATLSVSATGVLALPLFTVGNITVGNDVVSAARITAQNPSTATLGIDINAYNTATQVTAGHPWMRLGGASSEWLMINAGLTSGYVDICSDLGSGLIVRDGTGGHATYLTTPATGTLRVTTNGSTLGTVEAASLTLSSTTSLLLGTAGSAVGTIGFNNATSGTTTLAPATGALGTGTVTLPLSGTLAISSGAQTFTGVQSMTSPDITTSITTPSTTFAIANATATTLNIGGAATTIAMGAAGAGTMNIRLTTSASSATTGALTIGNGTAATNVGIGGGNINAGGAITAATGTITTLTVGSGNLSLFGGFTTSKTQAGYLTILGLTGLQLAGTTSAFPCIKRNAAAINFRLADDSADCNITAAAATFSGTLAVTGASTLTGNLTSNGAYISTPQALSGNGAVAAVNLTTEVTTIANTGTANTTTTLAAGTNGQKKVISFITDGGFDAVITVTNPAWGGAGTITMNDALDNIEMRYLNSVWQVFINNGCTLA